MPLGPGKIYDANRYGIIAALTGLGCAVTDLGQLCDHREVIRGALLQAAAANDLILTSGGVSVGDEDHVRSVLAEEGTLDFWNLALKPGKPVAAGSLRGVPFVGLPGNPVAAMIAFLADRAAAHPAAAGRSRCRRGAVAGHRSVQSPPKAWPPRVSAGPRRSHNGRPVGRPRLPQVRIGNHKLAGLGERVAGSARGEGRHSLWRRA